MAPLMTDCIAQFGPDRCMFESNCPPDKVSFSHHVLFNAFKTVSQGYSAAERAALFHDRRREPIGSAPCKRGDASDDGRRTLPRSDSAGVASASQTARAYTYASPGSWPAHTQRGYSGTHTEVILCC